MGRRRHRVRLAKGSDASARPLLQCDQSEGPGSRQSFEIPEELLAMGRNAGAQCRWVLPVHPGHQPAVRPAGSIDHAPRGRIGECLPPPRPPGRGDPPRGACLGPGDLGPESRRVQQFDYRCPPAGRRQRIRIPGPGVGSVQHVAGRGPRKGCGQGVSHRPPGRFQRPDAGGYARRRGDGTGTCGNSPSERRNLRRSRLPDRDAPVIQNRWVQLTVMVLSTVMLSNMQYGWTLFVNPMRNETHCAMAGIQLAFSILIFLNTWLAPLEGWVADRYGPRFVVMLGGLAAGSSWVLNSRAHSLQTLYVAAAVGGLGIGCVFGTCMGTALKWFPERRGFAAGMIAAGYGLGAAITSIPTSRMILASGYRHAFFFFGLL